MLPLCLADIDSRYIPRNGILNIQQTVDGLEKLYNMAPTLGAFLAAYSIAFDGDAVALTWSIGGPLPANPASALTGVPQGDGYSHNNYEGDTSISRCDSYTNVSQEATACVSIADHCSGWRCTLLQHNQVRR